MTPDDREAAIKRLRSYRDKIDAADKTIDRDSLDRAADLIAVYDDKQWVQQLPPPKSKQWRGQPVDPESFARFTIWAKESIGLTPMRCYQLRAAHGISRVHLNSVSIEPQGEAPLRPLSRLVKLGYAERGIPEVWEQAVAEAGGTAPTAAIVKSAMGRWIADNVPKKPRFQSNAERSIKSEKRRIISSFEQLLRIGDAAAARATVEEQAEMFEEWCADHSQEPPA